MHYIQGVIFWGEGGLLPQHFQTFPICDALAPVLPESEYLKNLCGTFLEPCKGAKERNQGYKNHIVTFGCVLLTYFRFFTGQPHPLRGQMEKLSVGDKIGCGLEHSPTGTRTIYFTKNGKAVSCVLYCIVWYNRITWCNILLCCTLPHIVCCILLYVIFYCMLCSIVCCILFYFIVSHNIVMPLGDIIYYCVVLYCI